MSDSRQCEWCNKPILPGDDCHWFDDKPAAAGFKQAPAELYCSEPCIVEAMKKAAMQEDVH